MKTLQAAVIGCGSIHTCHVAAIRHEPDCQLRAIAECDIGKGRALAQEYGCDFYTDYHEMLCDPQIDVVHICLPHHLHKEAILAALAAGRSPVAETMRPRMRFWLNVCLFLGVITVVLGSVLRTYPRTPKVDAQVPATLIAPANSASAE